MGTPDPGAFWRIIQDYKVSSLFCAPTAFRAIKKEDPTGNCTKDYGIVASYYPLYKQHKFITTPLCRSFFLAIIIFSRREVNTYQPWQKNFPSNIFGNRADPDTVKWAIDLLQVPVIDNYWQTEIGKRCFYF